MGNAFIRSALLSGKKCLINLDETNNGRLVNTNFLVESSALMQSSHHQFKRSLLA